MGHGTCETCGCTKIHQMRGYEPAEKFLRRIRVVGDCWEWRGFRDHRGYGHFSVMKGISMPAHRWSYALHNGDLPDNLHVCHKCDNPPCVNPDHLFLGTHQDNMADKVTKGRQARGESAGHAVLKNGDVLSIREAYARGGVIQQELAEKFGVTQGLISAIVNRRLWTHI